MNPKLVLRLAGLPRLRANGERCYSVRQYVLRHAHHKVDAQKLSENITARARAAGAPLLPVHVPRTGRGSRVTPCTTLAGMLEVRKFLRVSEEYARKCSHGYKKGKYYCPQCRGGGRCGHGTRRDWCAECDPVGFITKRLRSAIYSGLQKGGRVKQQRTLTYLGVQSFDEVTAHIQRKMDAYNATDPPVPMTLHNIAIDHIKPKAEFMRQGGPDDELHHYTNLQPLLTEQNLRKSDYWSAEAEAFWRAHIIHRPDYHDLFVPSGGGAPIRSQETLPLTTPAEPLAAPSHAADVCA